MSRSLIPNSTQVPDVILDEWLPTLSPPEFKVVMLIARKTFGWGKKFDRLSLSQIEEDTGLSRTTVKTAVAALVKAGRIRVDSGNATKSNAYMLNLCPELAEGTAEPEPEPADQGGKRPRAGNALGQKAAQGRAGNALGVGRETPTQETEERDKEKETVPQSAKKHSTPEGGVKRGRASPVSLSPPSLEEVRVYFMPLGWVALAEEFLDFQTARGWRYRAGPVTDWQAAARTWKRMRDKFDAEGGNGGNGRPDKVRKTEAQLRGWDTDELRRIAAARTQP